MSFPSYASYRDSGVKWLGQVPVHWTAQRVKNVASFNDEVIAEDTPEDYEIEYLEISGVQADRGVVETAVMAFGTAPSRARRKVRDGDVLVSTVRTYLKAIAPIRQPNPNLIVSTGFAVIRARTAHPGFLGYALRSEGFIAEVIARSVGVSYPAINAGQLVDIPVALPTLDEQVTVAAFLDRETAKIDALVEEQRRLIEVLKEKRQAVISHAVTKGLDPTVPMKESGVEWLGKVPADWTIKRLKHLSPAVTVGIVVNPSTYTCDEGLPYIFGGDITPGEVNFENARRISPAFSATQPKTMLRSGDLVTVRVGAPGITAVVPPECEGGNCASVMLVRKGSFPSAWLCHAMNSRSTRFQVEVVKYGAAQEQFNIAHAVNFQIPTPPLGEALQIAEHLERECGRIDNLRLEAISAISLLDERRSALISAAVTGKIDVRSPSATVMQAEAA